MNDARHSERRKDGGSSLWLDVTRTSQVAMLAGIPRIVRGLHRELGKRIPVVPVQWIENPGWYAMVLPDSPEERRLVSGHTPGGLSRLFESLTRWTRTRRLTETAAFGPGAIWLAPEPFREKRAAYWTDRKGDPTRRIAIFYDATPLFPGSDASQRRKDRYAAYMRALQTFDCVIAISRESREDLLAFWRERGLPGTTVVVEPLPCDFASQSRQASPNYDASSILVVSTLDTHKNHSTFLKACDALWNQGLVFSVRLIGRSSGHTGRRIQSTVAAMAEAGRPVAWQESVDETGLMDAYRRSSFTVYPSLKEGFGLPILESLWHGRPCVCGSGGALGEAATGGGCVTVDQTDTVSLAAGMRQLLTDRAAYMRCYDEAMRRRFRTWDDYTNAVVSILHDMARNKRRCGAWGLPTFASCRASRQGR